MNYSEFQTLPIWLKILVILNVAFKCFIKLGLLTLFSAIIYILIFTENKIQRESTVETIKLFSDTWKIWIVFMSVFLMEELFRFVRRIKKITKDGVETMSTPSQPNRDELV